MMRSQTWLIVGILVLTSTSLAAQTPSPDDTAVAKQLIGLWRLVSWPQKLEDGTVRQSPQSVGYLIYTDTNPIHMCYMGMNPNLPKWNSADPNPYSTTAPTAAEALARIAGFTAYCSDSIEVHAKDGFILHHVDIDIRPNRVGLMRKRHFKFEGPNRVSLQIDTPELTPPVVESTLIWERVQ
jgi:hypothetical protein